MLAIVNVTPDSFSDGGEWASPQRAAERAAMAVQDGADALDIGGESTRPGASRVDAAEQIRRVAPAVRAIRDAGVAVPISVDTTLSEVARAALDAGADAINDVSAGREDDRLFALAAERAAGLILMHRVAPPDQDRYSDRYEQPPRFEGGVVEAVRRFLTERAAEAERAGVAREALVLDPGLGFGKSVEQNLELSARLSEAVPEAYTALSAASRKSFIGASSGVAEPRERVAGSLAAAVMHRLAGAALFRVHDVAAHVAALRVVEASLRARGG